MKVLKNPSRKYGISQGRLTKSRELQRFPYESWKQEFYDASRLGISFIELLTERKYNKENPIWSESGRKEIKDICNLNNSEIYSICADYIIDHSLLFDSSALEHLENLFDAAHDLGSSLVILPMLEKSNLDSENMSSYIKVLRYLSRKAASHNLIICIESLLKSSDLVNLLDTVNEKNLKAVFDTGNRVLECNNLENEIIALKKYIQHIHIKDKNEKGENVILGTGLVNFSEVFSALNYIKYKGALNFETTRGSDPIETARYHINLCNFFTNDVL